MILITIIIFPNSSPFTEKRLVIAGREDFESHRSHWWVLSCAFFFGVGFQIENHPSYPQKKIEQYLSLVWKGYISYNLWDFWHAGKLSFLGTTCSPEKHLYMFIRRYTSCCMALSCMSCMSPILTSMKLRRFLCWIQFYPQYIRFRYISITEMLHVCTVNL